MKKEVYATEELAQQAADMYDGKYGRTCPLHTDMFCLRGGDNGCEWWNSSTVEPLPKQGDLYGSHSCNAGWIVIDGYCGGMHK